MRGLHVVSHWSRTQLNVALSSGEAELNAINKEAPEGLGAFYMSQELGEMLRLEMHTDSSAARGVIQRTGSGRIKHFQVKQVWFQERESRKQLTISKLLGARNVADLLTHRDTDPEWNELPVAFGVERRSLERGVVERGSTDLR